MVNDGQPEINMAAENGNANIFGTMTYLTFDTRSKFWRQIRRFG